MVKQIVRASLVTLLAAGTASFAQDAAGTYKAKCQMCHGADGSGNAKMKVRSLSSPEVLKMSDDDLIAITTNGKNSTPKMPAFKGKLTDDQIKGLIAYIHTLQKK